MLSDFGNTSKTYALSLGYSNTASGASDYNSVNLGLRYRAFDWLQVTASIPYSFIDGHDVMWDYPATGVRKNVFEYENNGLGDISVMGWFDLLYPFRQDETAAEKEVVASDTLEGTGKPLLFLGLGAKLDTGTHDEWDQTKYDFDRSKALTGELSDSDGRLPSRYQLGTGTTDTLFGLIYQQRFGRFTPSAAFSYQMSGGENSIGYERSDSVSWAAGLQYVIYQPACNRRLYVNVSLSRSTTTSRDFDHSEDTTRMPSQPKGRVAGTQGTYNFYGFGIGYDLTEDMTVSAACTLPLNNPDEDSEYSFDRSVGVSLQYRF
jgi:hypothetical protein